MNQYNNINTIEEDEIDLKELFATIWNNKFKIAIFTFIVTSLTIIYTISIPNSYKSEVILAPQNQSKSSIGGGLSALAGLAGVSLGGGAGMDAFSSLNTILQDNAFNKMVIEKYHLIDKLDSKNQYKNLVFALGYSGIYDFFHSKEDKKEEKDYNEKLFDTIKNIKEIVSLSSDKKSGAISLSVTLQDRFLAKQILDIYLKESTSYLRKLDMIDVDKKLKYYKKELANSYDIELKTQLSSLISSLVQKKVLSQASEFYIVRKMVEPQVAFIKDKTKPKRGLIVIVSFITSIILGIFMIFFLEFIKGTKEP